MTHESVLLILLLTSLTSSAAKGQGIYSRSSILLRLQALGLQGLISESAEQIVHLNKHNDRTISMLYFRHRVFVM